MSRLGAPSAQQVAIFLAAALVLAVVLFGITRGLGQEDVPSDAVAVVDGDEITQEEFDRSLAQAASAQGRQEPPSPDDPQFQTFRDQALSDLLDIAWIQKEAEERGVEVSDREVEQRLEQIKQQNFRSEEQFQQFIRRSGFTDEDVSLRIELQLLSEEIQMQVQEEFAEVSDDEIEDFYEQNKGQFQQPETRDVRLVLNEEEKFAAEAKTMLEQDDSDENWKKVAKGYSGDPASKDKGGLRRALAEGTLPEELDEAVFAAEEGEFGGPIQTDEGFYVFQVQTISEEGSQSVDEASEQIRQQLEGQKQQEGFSAFVEDYQSKWTEVTVCAEDFLNERCDNFEAAAAPECTGEQADQVGCPPPVLGRSPATPGQGGLATPGLPQRPHPPGADPEGPGAPGAIPGGLPPGAGVPTGP